MERTPRFAVTGLGVVTLSIVFGVPRNPSATEPARPSGQTAPAVIWHFDSLPAGQPPAGCRGMLTGRAVSCSGTGMRTTTI